jgi:flagellar biosynthesis protein FlhF
MNVRRFTARTSREAWVLVRQALGEDAVVLSTKPCADGVEVLAMAPEGMRQIELLAAQRPAAQTPAVTASAPQGLAARSAARAPALATMQAMPSTDASPVEEDVAKLSMSTLSFQDYVRERMLKRRQSAMHADAATVANAATAAAAMRPAGPATERSSVLEQRMSERTDRVDHIERAERAERTALPAAPLRREPPLLSTLVPADDDILVPGLAEHFAAPRSALPADAVRPAPAAHARRDQDDMLSELRQVRGLIEERFGALAFMEKLGRQPKQALLTQKLLDCGFSPALIRKIGDSLPAEVSDEIHWAAGVLERNLLTAEAEAPLEDQGGVYALVGATGVGKTTTTAKIAAAFATKYGAANLGLITLDAYRIGAHEQLRAYGRILGVPVHTAHDRASLEDLLDLLSAKKMVLIDTAGMAQRDSRTRELLDMLSHRSIQKLLVINAASQGETIEDVMVAYRGPLCAGVVLSKMDEAVKLGPALDALIRNKLKLVGVANGQRVPEDWHRLSANGLVQRALRSSGSSAYRLDASDVSLIFTAPISHPPARAAAGALTRSTAHA